MPADPRVVARIAAILRRHLKGEGAERIARVAAEIGEALPPAETGTQARHVRLAGAGRTGELPDRIFALLMDGVPRTVAEICESVATDGVTRKQVYSGLGYLIRRHEIERMGHACYRARPRALEQTGAVA